jgi:hypothetical protein
VFSHQEDVTFANPYGPPVRGWEQGAKTMERAASYIRDGKITGFENVAKYVTLELAYVVAIERGEAKFGGREDVTPFALRATMILRPEEGKVLGLEPGWL